MLRSSSSRRASTRGRAFAQAAMLLALAAATPTAARAAAPSPAPAPAATASSPPEITRVTTSDRHAEALGATTRPTAVVTRAQIDARGARTIADALEIVPGVNLFSYGGFGAQVDYGIRGAGGSARTLVLLNGTPIDNASSGTVDLGQFSTAAVERIEIVESGSSTLYGTNASGGVINIVTRPQNGVDAAAADGSYGDRDLRASVGNGTVGLSVERRVAPNAYPYPAFSYQGAVKPTFPAANRNGAYADATDGRVDLATSLHGFDLRGSAGLATVQFGIPGGLGFPTPGDSQATNRGDAQLALARTLGAQTLSITLSGATEKFAFQDPVGATGQSDTYDGRAQVALEDVVRGRAGTAVIGLDLARESAALTVPTFGVAGAAPDFGANESQSAAYFQGTASVTPFASIEAGLRAESDTRLGVANSGERDRLIAPSVGFTAHGSGMKLSANYGESFRVPTLVDLYYPGASNPNLRPEKAANLDATLAYEAPGGGGISAGYFATEASNYIVFDLVKFVPLNDEHASIAGLTLGLHAPVYRGVRTTLDFTDTYRALNRADGSRLPRDPVLTTILNVEKPFEASRVAYGLRARIVGTGLSNGSDRAANATATYDAYTKLDGYLRYRVAPMAIVTARVFNAGNQTYAPVFGYPAPGRTFALELSTR